jgi:hypothetical protein
MKQIIILYNSHFDLKGTVQRFGVDNGRLFLAQHDHLPIAPLKETAGHGLLDILDTPAGNTYYK